MKKRRDTPSYLLLLGFKKKKIRGGNAEKAGA
jgi:hypothetical protein